MGDRGLKFLYAVAFAAGVALPAGFAASAEIVLAVPTVTIYPGDLIGDTQIVEREFPASAAGKFPVLDRKVLVVGKVARRTLLPGRPIPMNGVKDADVISRGDSVIAIYRSGGLTITSVVLPLKSGGTGDIIEARNVDSGQIIRGEVQPDGTLRVGIPR